jgi:hypothetical protein
MKLNDKIKRLGLFDIALIKLSVAAFVLFLITVPNPANNFLMAWVHSVHWGWFLVFGIILSIIPMMKVWGR